MKSPTADEGADASRSRDTRSVAEIRHEIQRTRADLDATVDALGQRLRPKNLLWRARRRVEPEAREAGRRVAATATGNKATLATAAGAVAGLWLLRKAIQRRGRKQATSLPPEQ